MTALTADFDKGTNGSTVSTGDAGSLTVFDRIDTTGMTVKYDNTQVAHGALSLKTVCTSGHGGGPVWIAALGTVTADFGRFYYYQAANPSARSLINLYYGGGFGYAIGIDNAATITLVQNGNATLGTLTSTVASNQWVRFEWHVVWAAGTGSYELKYFASADSITPTETKTLTALTSIPSNGQEFHVGANQHGDAVTQTAWWDQVVAKATAYPGPFPVNTTAPGVTGSTPVGSVLTCDGGTWNNGGTFTLAYQWTRDGSNIGSATASTYTTVTADIGHAVGCTVTATGVQATNESASTASASTITPASASATTPDDLPAIYATHISQL